MSSNACRVRHLSCKLFFAFSGSRADSTIQATTSTSVNNVKSPAVTASEGTTYDSAILSPRAQVQPRAERGNMPIASINAKCGSELAILVILRSSFAV